MYAWIEKAADPAFMNLRWWSVDCLSAPAAPKQGTQAVRALLDSLRREQSDAEAKRLQAALEAMLPWLPADPAALDHALHLALLHHIQPEATRTEREKSIAQHVDALATPDQGWPAPLLESFKHVQRMAVLTPDELLRHHTRTALFEHLRRDFDARTRSQPELNLVKAANTIASTVGGKSSAIALDVLMASSLLAAPFLFSDTVNALRRFITSGRGKWVEALLTQVCDPTFRGSLSARVDALDKSLGPMIDLAYDNKTDIADASSIIEATGPNMHNSLTQAQAQALNRLITALEHGVVMGTRGAQSLDCWNEVKQHAANQTAPRTAQWLRDQVAGKPSPETAPPVGGDMRPEEVSAAWIDLQTADLLDGPLATDEEPPPINPTQARDKLKARNTRARTASAAVPNTPRKLQPVPPGKPTQDDSDWNENDVTLVLRQTLSHSAGFFREEIQELVDRARELNTAEAQAEQAKNLLPTLDSITQSRESIGGARRALGQAERATQALRAAIQKAEGDQRLRDRFDRALTLALARETLRPGRKNGGPIGCHLNPTDWGWVEARYHRRWLSGVSSVCSVDGVRVPLRNDEALALHVTGKSLSGALFDVSVHLWRRLPGATSAPSDSPDRYPPMNVQDWRDTYITCAVLHVPKA